MFAEDVRRVCSWVLRGLFVLCGSLFLVNCTVIKIVDVAASTTIGVAKAGVKTTGKVVGAAIPDGDDEEDEDED